MRAFRLAAPASGGHRRARPQSVVLWFVLEAALLFAPATFAANHPPVTGKGADCSSCHADLLAGKSVHSQGEIACLLCHTAEPDESAAKVTIKVILPQDGVCFACHERSTMQQHWAESKRDCLGCHDAHRSARAMLLHRDVEINYTEPGAAKAGKKP